MLRPQRAISPPYLKPGSELRSGPWLCGQHHPGWLLCKQCPGKCWFRRGGGKGDRGGGRNRSADMLWASAAWWKRLGFSPRNNPDLVSPEWIQFEGALYEKKITKPRLSAGSQKGPELEAQAFPETFPVNPPISPLFCFSVLMNRGCRSSESLDTC